MFGFVVPWADKMSRALSLFSLEKGGEFQSARELSGLSRACSSPPQLIQEVYVRGIAFQAAREVRCCHGDATRHATDRG
jgi:hypothetical protein